MPATICVDSIKFRALHLEGICAIHQPNRKFERDPNASHPGPSTLALGDHMNRVQILERLKLGRMIEAELTQDSEGRRGFVEIRPNIDAGRATRVEFDGMVEPTLHRAIPNSDVVSSYRIRWIRLNKGWESEPNDWDHYVHAQGSGVLIGLPELEHELNQRLGITLEAFQATGNTDSPL